jgi:hypothetical protein
MNYTAIGDAINLASRLEGLNKLYGTSIIASGTIVERANEVFDFRLLDVVAVKGKSDPITIYELLGTKGAFEHCRQVVSTYETAFSAYAAGKFESALAVLQENTSFAQQAGALDLPEGEGTATFSTSSKQDRARYVYLGISERSGDRIEGWLVRVVNRGRVLGIAASSPSLEELASRPDKLKPLVATAPSKDR